MACEFQFVPPVGQPGEHLPIGSGYGVRVDPITGESGSWHAGIDIPAPKFTPVRAAMDGTILKSYYSQTGGNVIWMNHGNGVQTRYMHLAYPGLYNEGELVRAGVQIGAVGSSGDRVTGNHLHFELRVDDKNVDPTDCYNNAQQPAVNPYEIPADYTGSSQDYAETVVTNNRFPWWTVFAGATALGIIVLVATNNSEEKPKRRRKRK